MKEYEINFQYEMDQPQVVRIASNINKRLLNGSGNDDEATKAVLVSNTVDDGYKEIRLSQSFHLSSIIQKCEDVLKDAKTQNLKVSVGIFEIVPVVIISAQQDKEGVMSLTREVAQNVATSSINTDISGDIRVKFADKQERAAFIEAFSSKSASQGIVLTQESESNEVLAKNNYTEAKKPSPSRF